MGTTYVVKQSETYINFLDYAPAMDMSDADAIKFNLACTDAYEANKTLLLPVGSIKINSSIINLPSIIGVRGQTKLIIDSVVDKTAAYNNQFIFQNANFANSYNANTADEISIDGVIIEITPQQNTSIFGFANIKKLSFSNCKIVATSITDGGTGRPFAIDSLIDLYASVKNTKIFNNEFRNETYARPEIPYNSGGGGCIWVRNINGDTTAAQNMTNATEDIEIYGNRFYHNTSDECLAIYGVVGRTRRIKVHHNWFYGEAVNPSNVAFHNTFISVFPLKHATLGTYASVEDVHIHHNHIEDNSWFYSVMRFGNTSDSLSTNICRRIKSSNNTIIAYRSTDATYKPHAIWLANGSSGTDPDTANLALRAIRVANTYGSFKNASFISDNDTIVSTGDSVLQGIVNFDYVSSPTTKGPIWQALASCTKVDGGDIEATAYAYYNSSVTGGNAKVNLSTGSIYYVDSTSGNYSITGVSFNSTGRFALVAAAATINTCVSMKSCSGSTGNATLNSIENASATAIVISRSNEITGLLLLGTGGTIISSQNRYAAVYD